MWIYLKKLFFYNNYYNSTIIFGDFSLDFNIVIKQVTKNYILLKNKARTRTTIKDSYNIINNKVRFIYKTKDKKEKWKVSA